MFANDRQVRRGTFDRVVKDAETGQRGFLLTGEARYLAPYGQALTELPHTLDNLSRATAVRRPDQVERLERLRPLIKEKLDELGTTIAVRRSQGPEAALAIVRTDRGRQLMEQIRAGCADAASRPSISIYRRLATARQPNAS